MSSELYDFEEDCRDYYKQKEKAKTIVDRFPEHKTIFKIENREYTLKELYDKGVNQLWTEYFMCIIDAILPSSSTNSK